MTIDLSLKGEISSQGSIAIHLSSNVCVGSYGGIIIISGRPDMKPRTDYRGRVYYISLEQYGSEVGNVEIDYSGEFISAVRYNYGNHYECRFYYENGKLTKVSGPDANYKVNWGSFNNITSGDRIW